MPDAPKCGAALTQRTKVLTRSVKSERSLNGLSEKSRGMTKGGSLPGSSTMIGKQRPQQRADVEPQPCLRLLLSALFFGLPSL
jgi:hypothetical protein